MGDCRIPAVLHLQMVTNFSECLKMDGQMDMVQFHTRIHLYQPKTVLNMKLDNTQAILFKENEKAKVRWYGLMEAILKATGKTMSAVMVA